MVQEDPRPVRGLNPEVPRDLESVVMKCMEKDPARRYSSAEDLAEDVARYLRGEAVEARGFSRLYRVEKKIRKNPVSAALLALATLAIAVLAGFAVYTRVQSQRSGRMLQEFGQEVAQIESMMRFAHLLPVHDIRNEKTLVGQRMAAIKAKMKQYSAAGGPGYYALGRGSMALNQYTNALADFRAAWDRYEYHEPQLAYSLGLTMALLYRDRLREVERISSPEQRELRKQEIRNQYRDPALMYLRQGRASAATDAPEYAQAVIHMTEGEYQKAIEESEICFRRIPWLYEAKKLQGDTYVSIGNDQRDAGDIAGSAVSFDKAESAFQESLKKGMSDSETYEALCSLHLSRLKLQLLEAGIPEGAYRKGLEACGTALKVNPESVQAYFLLSTLHTDWAYHESNHGIDAMETLDAAIRAGTSALNLAPNDVYGFLALGNAYAQAGISSVEDTSRYLDLSDQNYRKAISIAPHDALLHYYLGSNSSQRGIYLRDIGRDPRSAWDEAIREFQTALKLNPKLSNALNELAGTYTSRGEAMRWMGEDPLPSFEKSLSFFDALVAQNHRDMYTLIGEGVACWKMARYLVDHDSDPAQPIARGRSVLQEAAGSNYQYVQVFLALGNLDLAAARWNAHERRSPQALLASARAEFQRAFKISPRSFNTYEALAESYLYEAMWMSDQGSDPSQAISAGMEAASHAIELTDESFWGYVIRGRLLLLQARRASGRTRVMLSQKATLSLRKGFEINKYLTSEFAGDLSEAEKMAQ